MHAHAFRCVWYNKQCCVYDCSGVCMCVQLQVVTNWRCRSRVLTDVCLIGSQSV